MSEEKKRGAGQPPVFNSPEEMQVKIDEYFDWCDYEEDGTPRENKKPYTVTGLALYLGFCSRQSIFDYGKKAEYSYTIKTAKTRIENDLENALRGNSVAGVIFNLKNNFGWKDKHEVESSGGVNINVVRYSDLDGKE